MFSFNFAEVEEHQRRGDWESLTNLIVDEGLRLKNAGAQCLVICSNTLHMMADDVIKRVGVPLIHIADSTAELILVRRITRLGLLGTRPTMEGDFYTDRLRERYKLEVIIPQPEARGEIHRVIFEELCKGDIRDEARVFFEGVISDLVQRGAEGIILGCTEIEHLITDSDAGVPIFATAKIHAEAVARWSLRLDSAAKVLKSGG
jgi:aspartate racemase